MNEATSITPVFPLIIVHSNSASSSLQLNQITYALGFDVEYYNQYKVVTNNIVNETYVLYQCGAQLPTTSQFPKGTKFFEIPLTKVSAPETVPYAFIELLGLDDRVDDVSQFVTSPCGQKILACNHTSPDAMKLGNATYLKETLGPQIDGILTSSPYNDSRTFAFSAAQDPGVVNRAEWIKFLGLFFNREKYASDVFDGIAKEYNDTKTTAAADSANAGKMPVVAVASHYKYDKDESYQLDWAPYKLNLIQDAGGVPLDYNTIAAIPGVHPSAFSNTTLEFAWTGNNSFPTKEAAHKAFLQALSGADVIIDETYTASPASYNFTTFEEEYGINDASLPVDGDLTSSLSWLNGDKNGGHKLVFREDGLISPDGGLDIFEGAIARPAKLLADMFRAVSSAHPGSNALSTPNFTWIRNIDETPVTLESSECTRWTSCTAPPSIICPFVSFCPDGSQTVLVTDINSASATAGQGTCMYQPCDGDLSALAPAVANTAHMAAPAVVLLTVLIVFVEALINFC